MFVAGQLFCGETVISSRLLSRNFRRWREEFNSQRSGYGVDQINLRVIIVDADATERTKCCRGAAGYMGTLASTHK